MATTVAAATSSCWYGQQRAVSHSLASPAQTQQLGVVPVGKHRQALRAQTRSCTAAAGRGLLTECWDVLAEDGKPTADGPGVFHMDPAALFLKQRIVFLGSQVDDVSADLIISQLLLLDAQDPTKDIKMFINSPGGSVTAGMGIYDAMKLCRADVSTICFGLAASMGAFLLASGTKGKRYCMPNARVMIHQPLGGAGGAAIDVGIQVREMMYHKVKLTKLMSRLTGKPEDQVEADTDRDYFMHAWEAVEYGIVDAVIDDGKPGLVAPIGEVREPPKTRVWDYWTIKEGREKKVQPSEDILRKGEGEKEQKQSLEKEKTAV